MGPLRTVIDLRERQRNEAARALAAARQAQEDAAAAVAAAEAQANAIPRHATCADMLELYQRASQAARQRIIKATATFETCAREVERLAEVHRESCQKHQGVTRVADHRAAEQRRVADRRERSFLDDLAGRRVLARAQ